MLGIKKRKCWMHEAGQVVNVDWQGEITFQINKVSSWKNKYCSLLRYWLTCYIIQHFPFYFESLCFHHLFEYQVDPRQQLQFPITQNMKLSQEVTALMLLLQIDLSFRSSVGSARAELKVNAFEEFHFVVESDHQQKNDTCFKLMFQIQLNHIK